MMKQFNLNVLHPFADKAPIISKSAYITPTCSIVGDVFIGENSSIWHGTVIRGDVNHIRIGQGTNIQDLSVLHVSHQSIQNPDGAPLIIGNYVTVGHAVILHGCTIDDECLIGMGSIVMDKVIVQKHVMVAAGSLVPEGKVLESGNLYLGNPVRKLRSLTDEEIGHFMYSANHYIQLKNQYMAQ
jgi:carbonic anhydrase/acetyltransferase-like protein (isoleucine patch superfamily)